MLRVDPCAYWSQHPVRRVWASKGCHCRAWIFSLWAFNVAAMLPWLRSQIKTVSSTEPLARTCLKSKSFHAIGFKWSWHTQVQFDTDLFNIRAEYLYTKWRARSHVNLKVKLKGGNQLWWINVASLRVWINQWGGNEIIKTNNKFWGLCQKMNQCL